MHSAWSQCPDRMSSRSPTRTEDRVARWAATSTPETALRRFVSRRRNVSWPSPRVACCVALDWPGGVVAPYAWHFSVWLWRLSPILCLETHVNYTLWTCSPMHLHWSLMAYLFVHCRWHPLNDVYRFYVICCFASKHQNDVPDHRYPFSSIHCYNQLWFIQNCGATRNFVLLCVSVTHGGKRGYVRLHWHWQMRQTNWTCEMWSVISMVQRMETLQKSWRGIGGKYECDLRLARKYYFIGVSIKLNYTLNAWKKLEIRWLQSKKQPSDLYHRYLFISPITFNHRRASHSQFTFYFSH